MAVRKVYKAKRLRYPDLMSQDISKVEDERLKKELEARGYEVTKPPVWIDKTIQIEKDLWDRVEAELDRIQSEYKGDKRKAWIRDCFEEALRLWLDRQRAIVSGSKG
jgi:hypothetical protein